ncbi:MAG: glutathione S-transferase N-terminal domain-containing protein [Thalassovita sp.]
MKLYFAHTSPYARKARICVEELGLQDQVEQVFSNPFEEAKDLRAANPLGKVPALITDQGTAIYDSPVICAWLASLSNKATLIPDGDARWGVLTREAMADGILDSAYAIVMERRRPDPEQSEMWKARWQDGIARATAHANSIITDFEGPIDLGQIALAAALGYLDFRLPDIDWRSDNPALANWFADFENRPSMELTAPPAG